MRLGRDGVVGLICIAVSLALLVQSFSLPQLALMPVGPGFYPRIVLGLLGLGGLILLLQDLLAARAAASISGGEAASTTERISWRIGLLFGIVGAYALLMPLLGFRLATALFVLALMPAIEWPASMRAWLTVAAVAIATPLATFVIFERYLLVLLPRGSLTGW